MITREKRSVQRRTLILLGIREDHNETTSKLRKIILNLFRNDLKSNITENELKEVHRFGQMIKKPIRPVAIAIASEKRQQEIIRAAMEQHEWFERGIWMYVDDFFDITIKSTPNHKYSTETANHP